MKTNLCKCGCGGQTKIADHNDKWHGWKRGEPRSFLQGHNLRGLKGDQTSNWKGGITNNNGYILIRRVGHPRSNTTGYVKETILIAENILGKPLPTGSVIHHVNGDTHNNSNNNLVICQSQAYHLLLHQRTKSLENCGYSSWRKCSYCHRYDDPKNMYIRKRTGAFHQKCSNEYRNEKGIGRKGYVKRERDSQFKDAWR